jgi:hypothetical protein
MDNGHPEEDEVKSLVVSMLRQLTQKWRMWLAWLIRTSRLPNLTLESSPEICWWEYKWVVKQMKRQMLLASTDEYTVLFTLTLINAKSSQVKQLTTTMMSKWFLIC